VKIKNKIFSLLMNKWYNFISNRDVKDEISFLNYGYHDKKEPKLKKEDEKNRYGIQLYNKVINHVELQNKEILEVGCGKGGGASYIARYFCPRMITGIDISKAEIEFNRKHYKEKNLQFKYGDALNIPFPENSFDIVINVESSHGYVDFEKFLKEVKRVLKKGGFFLFTDFRKQPMVKNFLNKINNSGMEIISKEDITSNIVRALELDNKRRINLLKKCLPKMLHRLGKQFAGIKGSKLYSSFKNRKRIYFTFVLQNK
jgi:ubiquinone/menaquinone biosynthesis C-methylase UbiE